MNYQTLVSELKSVKYSDYKLQVRLTQAVAHYYAEFLDLYGGYIKNNERGEPEFAYALFDSNPNYQLLTDKQAHTHRVYKWNNSHNLHLACLDAVKKFTDYALANGDENLSYTFAGTDLIVTNDYISQYLQIAYQRLTVYGLVDLLSFIRPNDKGVINLPKSYDLTRLFNHPLTDGISADLLILGLNSLDIARLMIDRFILVSTYIVNNNSYLQYLTKLAEAHGFDPPPRNLPID